jgi:hypothetical protein
MLANTATTFPRSLFDRNIDENRKFITNNISGMQKCGPPVGKRLQTNLIRRRDNCMYQVLILFEHQTINLKIALITVYDVKSCFSPTQFKRCSSLKKGKENIMQWQRCIPYCYPPCILLQNERNYGPKYLKTGRF